MMIVDPDRQEYIAAMDANSEILSYLRCNADCTINYQLLTRRIDAPPDKILHALTLLLQQNKITFQLVNHD